MPAKPPSLAARVRHRLRFLFALLTAVLFGPLQLIALSFHSDDFNPLHHARSVSVHKSVHWSTHPVSVHRVKRIGKYYGASVNDVMMSVMVAAIDRATADSRSSMRTRSHQPNMHFLVPINVRPLLSLSASHRLGNLFAVLILPFPVAASSRRGRLLRMTRQMNGVKRSPPATDDVRGAVAHHGTAAEPVEWLAAGPVQRHVQRHTDQQQEPERLAVLRRPSTGAVGELGAV